MILDRADACACRKAQTRRGSGQPIDRLQRCAVRPQPRAMGRQDHPPGGGPEPRTAVRGWLRRCGRTRGPPHSLRRRPGPEPAARIVGSTPDGLRRAGEHDPQRVRASAIDTDGRATSSRPAMDRSLAALKTARASRLTARATSSGSTSPSPHPTTVPTAPGVSLTRRARRPFGAKEHRSPKMVISSWATRPTARGIAASRSAIQARRSRAKARASGSRRSVGATATASRRAASMRSETRRARRLTLSRTTIPSTSSRAPSDRRALNRFMRAG